MPKYSNYIHLSCHQEIDAHEDDVHINDPAREFLERPSRDHLYLPLEPSYRESSLSPSPASSISSRSWFSDASSCESLSHIYDDVDSELNEAAARFTLGSPLTSPGQPQDPHQGLLPPVGNGGTLVLMFAMLGPFHPITHLFLLPVTPPGEV